MLERYFIPLVPYLVAALGLLVCLYWTVTAESEIRRLKAKVGGRRKPEAGVAHEIEAKLAELNDRVRDAEERAGMYVPSLPPRSSLNVSKRTQVLRLSRRGEPPEKIAALLGLPIREVELLLKVHALAAQAATN
jgi:hypothetical protein